MWVHNPDGAGYMFARSGRVEIHKGFMFFSDFLDAVTWERFTESDSVVYHFRISTQAGRTPEMTHPFPLTGKLNQCEYLDLTCPLGIAHNGIIPITTDHNETRYSDTALFITRYLSKLISSRNDLNNVDLMRDIQQLGGWSRFAFLDGTGEVFTVGNFTEIDGILLSNTLHLTAEKLREVM